MFGKNKSKGFIPQNYVYTKKVKKRKLRIFFMLLYLFLLFGAISALFYFLFFTSYFEIKNVAFSGNKTVKTEALKEVFYNYLPEKKYYLSQDNIFSFSSTSFISLAKKEFRRVRIVEISKRLPSSLGILIEEYEPVGILCENKDEKGGCFYFDNEGVIFDDAPMIIGEFFLLVYDDFEIDHFGEKMYEKDFIDFMIDFKKDLPRETGFLVENFRPLGDLNGVEVLTKNGLKLLLDENQNPKTQVIAIKQIVVSKIKEDLPRLDYIDLRIKNKAYYKLKEVVVAEELEEEGSAVD